MVNMQTVTDAIPVPVFERHNTCLGCGYDLFGQPRLGVCPECGASTRESARHEAFLGAPGNLKRLRGGAVFLLLSAILSGLCPASCLIFMWSDSHIACAGLMSLIFAATVVTSAVGERRFVAMGEYQTADSNDRESLRVFRNAFVADLSAAGGLVLVNVAAYITAIAKMSRVGDYGWRTENDEVVTGVIVAIGFFLMCVTAWRAVPAYRLRGQISRAVTGGANGGFIGLGFLKAIYETLWLATVWMGIAAIGTGHDGEGVGVFLLFGALFGLGGYGILWLFMIGTHALLLRRVHSRLPNAARGFEVVGA